MRRLLPILLILLIIAFLIKALYGPLTVKQPAVVVKSAAPKEESKPVMNYKIPHTELLYKPESEDEKAREEVKRSAGVALGLPTKAAYSPNIAVPSKEEVAEEINMREKQRKDTEEKIAIKEKGLIVSAPFAFGGADTGVKHTVVAKDIKNAHPVAEGIQADDRRPIVFRH